MTPTQDKNQEYWREQIARGNRHPGGVASYCRAHAIKPAAFYYWKKRLRRRAIVKRASADQSFIPVEILRPEAKPSLPDARWLSELIVNLMRASR